MITICPQCQLSLAVSAADLRVAQGHVRCGRCASVFNALVSLYDSEAEAVEPAAGAGPGSSIAAGTEPQEAIEATRSRILAVTLDTDATATGANTGVFAASDAPPVAAAAPGVGLPDDAVPDADVRAAAMPEAAMPEAAIPEAAIPEAAMPEAAIRDAATPDAAATVEPLEAGSDATSLQWLPAANDPGIEEVVAANDPIADAEALAIRAPAPESIERLDIDLGALPAATEDWQVVPQLEPAAGEAIEPAEPEAPRRADDDADLIPTYDLDAERDAPDQPVESIAPDEPAAPQGEQPDDEAPLEELAPAEQAPRRAGLWAAGSVVLGLLLAAQWIHHQREALVGWPALTGPLTRFYAAIGQPIRLRGDLGAYDVRQLGAVAAADAAGTLTVRASLRNLSPRPQPMPLLRVTLQDRYGNRIASRDLTAAEYQQRPAGTAPMTLLAAGARLETSVQLVDPGGNAVGFELDVCLAENGATRCASDLAAAASR